MFSLLASAPKVCCASPVSRFCKSLQSTSGGSDSQVKQRKSICSTKDAAWLKPRSAIFFRVEGTQVISVNGTPK